MRVVVNAVRARLAPIVVLVVMTATGARPVLAQHHQTDFPPEEFRARWDKLFDRMGEDAVAGTPKPVDDSGQKEPTRVVETGTPEERLGELKDDLGRNRSELRRMLRD